MSDVLISIFTPRKLYHWNVSLPTNCAERNNTSMSDIVLMVRNFVDGLKESVEGGHSCEHEMISISAVLRNLI